MQITAAGIRDTGPIAISAPPQKTKDRSFLRSFETKLASAVSRYFVGGLGLVAVEWVAPPAGLVPMLLAGFGGGATPDCVL